MRNLKYLSVAVLLVSTAVSAELKYCKGVVYDLVVRDSGEAVQVRLKTSTGISNWARVGGTTLNDNQKVQASMLVAANLAGKEVMLELNTTGYTFNSCEHFDNGLPVRYVGFRP